MRCHTDSDDGCFQADGHHIHTTRGLPHAPGSLSDPVFLHRRPRGRHLQRRCFQIGLGLLHRLPQCCCHQLRWYLHHHNLRCLRFLLLPGLLVITVSSVHVPLQHLRASGLRLLPSKAERAVLVVILHLAQRKESHIEHPKLLLHFGDRNKVHVDATDREGRTALHYAAKNGLTPIARIKSVAVDGCLPEIMGIGPIGASKKALSRAGLTSADIDVTELNEAFSSQAMASISDLGLDGTKVNIDGGALAIGHPLGATGARIVGKAASILKRDGGKYALASQCIGGGQGIATILEAM